MSPRVKKLIGTFVLIAFLAVYALVAMAIGVRIPTSSPLGQWAYYVIAGLLWVIPAGAVVTWMQRQ